MKVLHFIKTSDGARWGLEMVKQLVLNGIEVTVVLPSKEGRMINSWANSGAKIIYEYSELPIKTMWRFFRVRSNVKKIIQLENPDIIHSHFFSQTILLRMISTKAKRIFQVPGPLHLENSFFKWWDILSSKENDSWIASSRYIYNLYTKAGISPKRLGLSYYGNELEAYDLDIGDLRSKYNIDKEEYVVGNLSYFYPPKAYLFQKYGLKGHDLLLKIMNDMKIKTLIFGAQIGESQSYYNKLKQQRKKHVCFAGSVNPFDVSKAWLSMDLCLHLPFSENCGGVLEPLLHGIPVLCCETGALGEVIINNKTGLIVPREESLIKEAIKFAKNNPKLMKEYSLNGQKLILTMFDVKRTSKEIISYYKNIDDFTAVVQFNSKEFNYDV